MRILRKCEVCGEEFIATKITNKYCSKRCARVVHRKKEAEKKKKARESKKDDAQNLQSLEIASRPFLTPSDVAFLLGVSVTTVYRCFYSGTLKAVRLRRKTYVRREDLDKYFEEAGAYKKKSYKRKDDQEYYTLREIMEKYHIGRKAPCGDVVTVWVFQKFMKVVTPSSVKRLLMQSLQTFLKKSISTTTIQWIR